MQDGSWKKVLSGLPLKELKEAQRFINELIPMLEAVEESVEKPTEEQTEVLAEDSGEGRVEIFPSFNAAERREDKRIGIEIEGVYSLIKDKESESLLPVQHIKIQDISKHGLRFVTNQFLLPSTILVVKFYLPPSDTNALYKHPLYKNPQKQIYAEVRRVIGVPTTLGLQYQIGAASIEREEALELLKQNEGFSITGKRLAMKGDLRILIVSIKEAQSKHLEKTLQNQGYSTYRVTQKHHAIALLRGAELLRKISFNVVITDMATAEMCGYELIKDIKSEFPNTGLIVEIATLEDWLKIAPLGVDEYLTKNFSDQEFETTIESMHKTILQKSLLGDYFQRKHTNKLNILVAGTDEVFKKFLCDESKRKGFKLYFVPDTKQAIAVLRKYKIEIVFIDTTIATLSECDFIEKVKKDFPGLEIMVISKNYQERHQFLVSGADRFFIAQMGMEEIAAVLF